MNFLVDCLRDGWFAVDVIVVECIMVDIFLIS